MMEERRDKRAGWVVKEAEGLVGISNLSAFLQVTRPLWSSDFTSDFNFQK
jgi:hypothetical protein